MYRFVFSFALVLAGCGGPLRADYDRLDADVERLLHRHPSVAQGPTTDPALDQILSGSLDVDSLVEVAKARNPELREALVRVRAALEESRANGALDDPMLLYRPWAVPINRPAALSQAEMNMMGLEQSFPFPGNLGLREEAALRQAEAQFQAYRGRERETAAEVRKTYFEYFALSKELEIRHTHAKILEEFEKITDAKFKTGIAPQQDVLRPQLELVMLQNDILALQQRLGSACARLNALLNRPDDAPLGRPAEIPFPDEGFDLKGLQATAFASRPDILAAESKWKSARAGERLAQREATLPDFIVGLDYMLVPDGDDAWGGMVGINLPWFTGKKSAMRRKAGHEARAEEIALEGARTRALYDVRDAFLRTEAARKSLLLFRGELLSKSSQTVEVLRVSYEKEKASFLDLLDAERSQREVEIRYYRTLADYESARADLERAVGVDLRRKP